MEDSEVLRDHSCQTGRKADFCNLRFLWKHFYLSWASPFSSSAVFLGLFFVVFPLSFLFGGTIEKNVPYFDQNCQSKYDLKAQAIPNSPVLCSM